MAVLVTGITGFVGSHLGRRLVAQGHEVHAILRPGSSTWRVRDYADKLRWIEGDLRQPESYRSRLERVRPECVFHLAWYAKPGRFWRSAENLDCVSMTLDLARHLGELGCRQLVAAGTCAEYAPQTGALSEEGSELRPQSLYGVAKNATREVLEAHAAEVGMQVAWARFFFIFGPDEPEVRLVPSVALALLRGERARCSHGRQLRDFVHVEDCASALCAIADRSVSGPVNIGTGTGTEIRTLVETLAGLAGRSAQDVDFGAVPTDAGEPPSIVADPRKLVGATGWQAQPLATRLAQTVEWWKAQAEQGRR